MPKSLRRKLKVIGRYLTSDESYALSKAKEEGIEHEEHALRYYKRKYGANNVELHKKSTSTGYVADITVKKKKK